MYSKTQLARAPTKTGKVVWMKEPYGEGVATHAGPESGTAVCEGRGEALTGVRAGWVMSREIREPLRRSLRGGDAVSEDGRPHLVHHFRELYQDPARSETPRMYATILHGSREVPRSSAARGAVDRIGKSKDSSR